MEAFGYLAVLISIILGLGIAELLGGMARRIEQRSAFRPFAPAMIWAGILLLIHIQTWWSMFGLRHLEQWTFVRFAVVLLQPIILYLMAVLALPSLNAPEIDLRLNYFGQRKWFFGLLFVLWALVFGVGLQLVPHQGASSPYGGLGLIALFSGFFIMMGFLWSVVGE